MQHAFATMGTVASISLDRDVPAHTLTEVERTFTGYDRVFSLYRDDSMLSAIARGDIPLEDAPRRVRDEYQRATGWRERTGGWFTPHRPDGVIDLSGTVKAAAIHAAGALLASTGAQGLLGVGGDLLVVGDAPQRIGIVDPADRTRMIADVELARRRAAATSGSAERGDHIWTRLGTTDIVQVTVLADDIVTADVLATAIVAAGTEFMGELLDGFDVDALVVTRDGVLATPGWPRVGSRTAAAEQGPSEWLRRASIP